jgi:hypothetical protein
MGAVRAVFMTVVALSGLHSGELKTELMFCPFARLALAQCGRWARTWTRGSTGRRTSRLAGPFVVEHGRGIVEWPVRAPRCPAAAPGAAALVQPFCACCWRPANGRKRSCCREREGNAIRGPARAFRQRLPAPALTGARPSCEGGAHGRVRVGATIRCWRHPSRRRPLTAHPTPPPLPTCPRLQGTRGGGTQRTRARRPRTARTGSAPLGAPAWCASTCPRCRMRTRGRSASLPLRSST